MNKFVLALLLLSTYPLYAQDDFPAPPTDLSDAPDISQKMYEEPVPTEIFSPELSTTSATPDPVVVNEIELEEKDRYYVRKSRWVTTFGFEHTKYPTIFEFEGRKDFEKGDKELWGGRIGFGGELYLGGGLVTRSMVEGYYVGTLFSRTLNGGEGAEDVKFAFTKQTGQIFGIDVSQSLGWLFDYKTKNPFMGNWTYMTFEPFIEAGIGKGSALNRLNYSYDTGTTPTSSQEQYRLKVTDELINARIGAGFNITSKDGFFLMARATVNRFEVTSRKLKGFTQPNGQTSTPLDGSVKNANIDPVLIYTLGGGYKF